MSVSYNFTPGAATVVDRLRMLIPDRPDNQHSPPAMFCDEELNDLYSIYATESTPLLEAAASACEIVAFDKAKQAISFSINGVNINKASIASLMLQRVKMFRDRIDKYAATGYEDIDVMEYNIDQWGQDKTEFE